MKAVCVARRGAFRLTSPTGCIGRRNELLAVNNARGERVGQGLHLDALGAVQWHSFCCWHPMNWLSGCAAMNSPWRPRSCWWLRWELSAFKPRPVPTPAREACQFAGSPPASQCQVSARWHQNQTPRQGVSRHSRPPYPQRGGCTLRRLWIVFNLHGVAPYCANVASTSSWVMPRSAMRTKACWVNVICISSMV